MRTQERDVKGRESGSHSPLLRVDRWREEMNPALPPQVIMAMAARPERLHHMLWHLVRNDWLSYPADVRQKLADMGWEPPRPARTAWEDGYLPIPTNNSGED